MQHVNSIQEQLLFGDTPITNRKILEASNTHVHLAVRGTLTVLSGFCNPNGITWVGLEHIAGIMSADRGTIKSHVACLERAGIVTVLGKRGRAYVRQVVIPDQVAGTNADTNAGTHVGSNADTNAGTYAEHIPHYQNRTDTEQTTSLPVDDSAQISKWFSDVNDQLQPNMQIKRYKKIEALLTKCRESGLSLDEIAKHLLFDVGNSSMRSSGGTVTVLEQIADKAQAGYYKPTQPYVAPANCVDLPKGTDCTGGTHTAIDDDGRAQVSKCPLSKSGQ